jgi:hypothetical protein
MLCSASDGLAVTANGKWFAPNGNARLLSLTVGPRWQFPIGGFVDGYILGGVGCAAARSNSRNQLSA